MGAVPTKTCRVGIILQLGCWKFSQVQTNASSLDQFRLDVRNEFAKCDFYDCDFMLHERPNGEVCGGHSMDVLNDLIRLGVCVYFVPASSRIRFPSGIVQSTGPRGSRAPGITIVKTATVRCLCFDE